MFKLIAVILVFLILLPAIAFTAQKKALSDKELLKNAHQMVRFWWSIWITYGTIRAYKMLTIWRLECTRLMKKAGK